MLALPVGDGDGGLGAGGGEEREDEEELLGALLDDDELAIEAFQQLDGAGKFAGEALELDQLGAGERRGLEQGEAFGEEADLALEAGSALKEGKDARTDEDRNGGLDGENREQVGEEVTPGADAEEAGEEDRDGGGGGEGERVAEDGVEGWRQIIEPLVEEGAGELLEAGGSQESDFLPELDGGKEFADGLLAEEGFVVGGWGEKIARETAFADPGANRGEEAEEGVRTCDIEVVLVEMGRYGSVASSPVREVWGSEPLARRRLRS